MNRSQWLATAAFLFLLTPRPAAAQQKQRPIQVTTAEAAQVRGKVATVCGVVASTHLAMHTGGAPTFINFDKPNPNQTFTVLIWGIDRPKFAVPPESTFTAGKRVCATGAVTDFRGVPEIIVHGPDEIRVEAKGGR